MKADNRKTWSYKGLKIVPVDCQHPTWGKCGTPHRFETALRNRYWRIELTEKHSMKVEFKSSAKAWIDNFEKNASAFLDNHKKFKDARSRLT